MLPSFPVLHENDHTLKTADKKLESAGGQIKMLEHFRADRF
jgi:hypothetical protein